MDISLPLEQLSVKEKLLIMESIWADLSRREGDGPSPTWHEDVLHARERRLAAGQDAFVEWEQAKRQLRESTR